MKEAAFVYILYYICTHLEERLILETKKSMCPLMAVVEGTQEASKCLVPQPLELKKGIYYHNRSSTRIQ
jgi:hypothetical protein